MGKRSRELNEAYWLRSRREPAMQSPPRLSVPPLALAWSSRLLPQTAILIGTLCSCIGTMALTPSTMLPLETVLPAFSLPTAKGSQLASNDLDERPILLMVICSHCPFVKHIEPELTRLEQDFGEAIQMVGISSNSLITHPQDGADQLADQATRHGWRFPYLMDQEQTLAKALQAACTPEFYLFAQTNSHPHSLRYRGQLDRSRPGNDQPLNGADLRQAINAVLNDQPVNPQQIASVGCNVKWHPGQEPSWFG